MIRLASVNSTIPLCRRRKSVRKRSSPDSKAAPFPFQGYAYTREKSDVSGQPWVRYDESKPQVWNVPLSTAVKPAATASAPKYGYVVPAAWAAAIAEKLKLHMLEVPIHFEDRRVGKSKMTTLVKIEAALRVFEIRWRNGNLGLICRIHPSYSEHSPNLEKGKHSAIRHR